MAVCVFNKLEGFVWSTCWRCGEGFLERGVPTWSKRGLCLNNYEDFGININDIFLKSHSLMKTKSLIWWKNHVVLKKTKEAGFLKLILLKRMATYDSLSRRMSGNVKENARPFQRLVRSLWQRWTQILQSFCGRIS